ncbi:hypothetical protein JOS77_06260 [Chromobacterium haemolyticum]|nr:hypothetical protein JOS77_06260 [Chromobacterium haemolyticum]
MHVFIVLGSPVTEVGRDHDYDWAIVEPSSMRSLIQLAGRLRRHRPEPWDKLNVLIGERNLRSVEQPAQPAFRWPGFEDEAFPLDSHLLSELLEEDEYRHLDARPRIVQPEPLQAKRRLSHLEHARLAQLMSPAGQVRVASSRPGREGPAIAPMGAYSCWQQPQALLSAACWRSSSLSAPAASRKWICCYCLPRTGTITRCTVWKAGRGRSRRISRRWRPA